MARFTSLYENDETEFSKKLNFAKPQLTGVSPVFGSAVEMPRTKLNTIFPVDAPGEQSVVGRRHPSGSPSDERLPHAPSRFI